MPNYLPNTLIYSGYILLFLSVLLSIAASFESRYALMVYCVISSVLLLRLVCLVLEINYSSLIMKEEIIKTCEVDLIPILDRDFISIRLDCGQKYT